jgi:Protein of unknown function (DUF2933)
MNHQHSAPEPWYGSPLNLALCGFLAIAAFFLITEHTAHVLGVLPYLLLLICPLIHLFGHGGHAGHASHEDHERAETKGDNR